MNNERLVSGGSVDTSKGFLKGADFIPTISLIIIFIVLYFVVPEFENMFKEMNVPFPPITVGIFQVSAWVGLLIPIAIVWHFKIVKWRQQQEYENLKKSTCIALVGFTIMIIVIVYGLYIPFPHI